jgi:hypothetical protein
LNTELWRDRAAVEDELRTAWESFFKAAVKSSKWRHRSGQSASPYLLVQEASRRKFVYLVGNTGLCQNPSFRHTTGTPKDGLAPFGILHCPGLNSSCAPPATRRSRGREPCGTSCTSFRYPCRR